MRLIPRRVRTTTHNGHQLTTIKDSEGYYRIFIDGKLFNQVVRPIYRSEARGDGEHEIDRRAQNESQANNG